MIVKQMRQVEKNTVWSEGYEEFTIWDGVETISKELQVLGGNICVDAEDSDHTEAPPTPRILVCTMKKGGIMNIPIYAPTYILNDEGKTIEAIK